MAQRSSTKPAAEPVDEVDESDPCGYGCHSAGVPETAASVGCEHGTYEVTAGMRRLKSRASRPPETVHDRSVHFPDEESEASATPSPAALGELLRLVNGQGEQLLKLEGRVRSLESLVPTDAAELADAGGE